MFEIPCHRRESFAPNQASYIIYFETVDNSVETVDNSGSGLRSVTFLQVLIRVYLKELKSPRRMDPNSLPGCERGGTWRQVSVVRAGVNNEGKQK